MKKIILSIMSLSLTLVILVGCQTNRTDEMATISVINVKNLGENTTEFFETYEDEETLEIFQDIFENAVKQDGIVDMSEPDFDIEVIYEKGDRVDYHLWLGEPGERSTLMNMEDTHTIYSISAEGTNQLNDFLN